MAQEKRSQSVYEDYFSGITTVFSPSVPPLRGLVNGYTFIEGRDLKIQPDVDVTPLPTGAFELYIHLKDSGSWITSPGGTSFFNSYLPGFFDLTCPCRSRALPLPQQEAVVVSFSHAGVLRVLGLTPRSFAGLILDLENLFGPPGKELLDKLNDLDQPGIRADLLNRFFLSRLRESEYMEARRYVEVVNSLTGRSCRQNLHSLSRDLEMSYLKIYRLFDRYLGASPKEYLKICRFNRACRLLSAQSTVPWADILLSCGYYDQAHFIHEFTSIMKISPRQFLEQTRGRFFIKQAFRLSEPSDGIYSQDLYSGSGRMEY